jgi:tRNA threonylcarbamoyladenosine biosynthesis protein TsaB
MPDLLLVLETSSPVCGVAVAQLSDGELVAQAELRVARSHASHLIPLTEQLLALTGHALADVKAVGLSAGPGSYTGLRIGVSSAKGLCAALEVPLVAVSTLQILAHQTASAVPDAARYRFCPLIDARRQEAFAGIFDAEGAALTSLGPVILTAEWLAETLAAGPVIFSGSGAAKCRETLGTPDGAHYLPHVTVPAVATLALLAGHKFQAALFEDVAYFEPSYLKEVHTTTPKTPVVVPPTVADA